MSDPITFERAREIVYAVADEKNRTSTLAEERVPLDQAAGRYSKNEIRSPIGTPSFESASMAGYAVLSVQTSNLRASSSVKLRLVGRIAAGQKAIVVDDAVVDGLIPCVEVMAGSVFPLARSTGRPFDALILHERMQKVVGGPGDILEATMPPLTMWHKRLISADFRQGELLMAKGGHIAPKDVMALASVGLTSLAVWPRTRAAVLSTGAELRSYTGEATPDEDDDYKIPDANGPYMLAALRAIGVDATYLGVVVDDKDILLQHLLLQLAAEAYDLIIINGAVCSGKFEHMPACVEKMNGTIHFRNVWSRPASQVLFATVPRGDAKPSVNDDSPSTAGSEKGTSPADLKPSNPLVIFGLPGDPISAAACFRFLVTPYIRRLSSLYEETEISAIVGLSLMRQPFRQSFSSSGTAWTTTPTAGPCLLHASPEFDIFRPSITTSTSRGVMVEIGKERGLAKFTSFTSSNCWVHIPRGRRDVYKDDVVSIYPFCSPRS